MPTRMLGAHRELVASQRERTCIRPHAAAKASVRESLPAYAHYMGHLRPSGFIVWFPSPLVTRAMDISPP